MSSETIRKCRRCLLKDIAPEEYLEHMRIYLAGLEGEVKSDERLYQERLAHCEACDFLKDGICRICGCFVEYRAAIKDHYCPHVKPKW